MYRACLCHFPAADITVMAAAVADFRPETVKGQKIKKKDLGMTLNLVPTEDILAALGREKRKGQILVGFALETNNAQANARKKLISKNLDLIILNSLKDKGAGFGYDTNKVSILDRKGKTENLPLLTKTEVAMHIAERVLSIFGTPKPEKQ